VVCDASPLNTRPHVDSLNEGYVFEGVSGDFEFNRAEMNAARAFED
jgi:hypothetical protein